MGCVTLFKEEAHLNFGSIGTFDGTDTGRDFAENVVGAEHPFLGHLVHIPIISIDDSQRRDVYCFEVSYQLHLSEVFVHAELL